MLFFILVCLTLEKVSHKKNLVFGEPCIFPWKDRYTNLTHQGCANPDQDEVGLWCPTQLDEDGYYPLYNGPGSFWGYCDENCNFTFTYHSGAASYNTISSSQIFLKYSY